MNSDQWLLLLVGMLLGIMIGACVVILAVGDACDTFEGVITIHRPDVTLKYKDMYWIKAVEQ